MLCPTDACLAAPEVLERSVRELEAQGSVLQNEAAGWGRRLDAAAHERRCQRAEPPRYSGCGGCAAPAWSFFFSVVAMPTSVPRFLGSSRPFTEKVATALEVMSG